MHLALANGHAVAARVAQALAEAMEASLVEADEAMVVVFSSTATISPIDAKAIRRVPVHGRQRQKLMKACPVIHSC